MAVDHLVTVCVCVCVRACMRLYTGVASATALQEVNEGIDSENENKLEKKYPLLRRGRNDHINEMS